MDDLEIEGIADTGTNDAIQAVAIEEVSVDLVAIEVVAIEKVSVEAVEIEGVANAASSRGRGRRPDDQVWTIRRLPARRAVFVLVLFGCVTAPVVVAFLRLRGLVGTTPRFTAFGDSAYLALRSRDVFAGPIPLVGSQSSAETAVNIMQPGPAQFFAQAPWIGWLGGDLGSLVFAALASVIAAVGSVWVTLRRFGAIGAAVAALAVIALEAQLGSGALVDTISSTHGQLLAFFAVLVCALTVTGDLRLFPLGVVVSSYVLQSHLSFVGYGLLFVPMLVAALALGIRRARRGEAAWFVPWAVAGVLIALVMWAPPLIDQFFDTGNLVNVFSAGSGEATVDGLALTTGELLSGMASVFGPNPALLAPPDRLLGQWYFVGRSDMQTNIGLALGAGAVILGLSSLVLGLRRARRARKTVEGDERRGALVAARRLSSAAAVLLCGVALALIGVLFASRLRGFAVVKPNNNRWIVIAGAAAWSGALLTLGSSQLVDQRARRALARRVRRLGERSPRRAGLARWGTPAAIAVVLIGCSVAVSVRPLEPTVADPWVGGSRVLALDVRDAWGDRGPVRFRAVGPISAGGLQPALMLDLEERGADTLAVGGIEALRAGYGEHRLASSEDPPYVLLQDGDIATPQFGDLIGLVVARPTSGDGTVRSTRLLACLQRADDAGAAVTLTADGRRMAAEPDRAGDDQDGKLLAAALADPRVLFITGLSAMALERGYIEPLEVEGCSTGELDELAGELLMSAWLVP